MASLERDSSVVFNYLSTSELWHYKRDGLGKKGTAVINIWIFWKKGPDSSTLGLI